MQISMFMGACMKFIVECNLSFALQMWLTFAPIPDYTSAFFGVKLEQVDWFSISFFVVSLLIGFLGIIILDKFGLRIAVSH